MISALLLGGIYGGNYLLPQKGVAAQALPDGNTSALEAGRGQENTSMAVPSTGGESVQNNGTVSGSMAENGTADESTEEGAQGTVPADTAQNAAQLQTIVDSRANGLPTTKVSLDTQDWRQKFADKFTDQVVSTDTSYSSPDISVQLSYGSYESGILDHSEGGRHEKYGSAVSYVVADIYVGDITCLQTCFAQDTYGVGYSEKLSDMSARMQSVLAVNGDSYSNSRHENNGTIIRNGIIYRAKPTDMETCVLNWDGTMKIYSPQELDTQTLIDSGAYQSWIFGPSLLDENGKAKTSFQTWDYIRESHPRTAIGYYEPGHYCLLVVDGRQKSSRGMFPNEMASLFEQLGCKAAYNLDGGHCSFMTLQAQVANHPYKPEHEVQDGIFIKEGLL